MLSNLSKTEYRLRIERIAEVLREFGLVDKFGLAGLFRRKKFPSVNTLINQLRKRKQLLPASITPEFVAKSIMAKLDCPDPDTIAWNKAYEGLQCELDNIPPGKQDPKRYHQHIFELLKAIFEGILKNPRIEQEVNEGLGFIDIVFDNNRASEGFFVELSRKHNIPCKYISLECKNYTGDLGNIEYNQLSNRLNEERGKVGFIICRSISDQKKAQQHCKQRFNDKKEYILILEDDDIKLLLKNRRKGDLESLDKILQDKFRKLFM